MPIAIVLRQFPISSQDQGTSAGVVFNHTISNTSDKDRIVEPACTVGKHVFHTIAGDMLSFHTLSVAPEGGLSKLSSSWRVYNELAETGPELLATLAEVPNFVSLWLGSASDDMIDSVNTARQTLSNPTISGLYFIACPRPMRAERGLSSHMPDGHIECTRPSFRRPTSHQLPKPKLMHPTLFTSSSSDSMSVLFSVKAMSSRSTSFTPVMGSSVGAKEDRASTYQNCVYRYQVILCGR